MKKIIAATLIIIMLFAFSGTAYADPTPENAVQTPDSGATPFELIKYKHEGEIIVRIQLRLRELGYFNFKPTGRFQTASVNATVKFQQLQLDENGQSIMADGSIGAQSMKILFSNSATRNDISAHIPIGESRKEDGPEIGVVMPWSDVKEMMSIGDRYRIIDFNTGVEFNMIYAGGENHAEMECASAPDSKTFLDVFGEEFNYSKRPVIITLGTSRIAASLQGFPHGDDTVSGNDMIGHCCLFFEGSLSHVGSLPDVEHLTQIYKAAGRA